MFIFCFFLSGGLSSAPAVHIYSRNIWISLFICLCVLFFVFFGGGGIKCVIIILLINQYSLHRTQHRSSSWFLLLVFPTGTFSNM